jgi:hypothetical protein
MLATNFLTRQEGLASKTKELEAKLSGLELKWKQWEESTCLATEPSRHAPEVRSQPAAQALHWSCLAQPLLAHESRSRPGASPAQISSQLVS